MPAAVWGEGQEGSARGWAEDEAYTQVLYVPLPAGQEEEETVFKESRARGNLGLLEA